MVSAEMTDFCDNLANLRDRKELQQKSIEQFWTEWHNEYIRYLPPLRLKKPNDELKEGSMVLIRDEGKPRLQWPLAIVTKLYSGRDGLIRAVDLRTAKGKISRTIQKLHKLEMFEGQINQEELQGATQGDLNDESMSMKEKSESAGKIVSSSGRVIKRRTILDL